MWLLLNLIKKNEFAKITTDNTYQRLFFDSISAPQIREPITGQGNISGNFSPETANDLASFVGGSYPLR